jgi:hypothetical protein
MKTDTARLEQDEFSDSSHAPNPEANSDKSGRKSRKNSKSAQAKDAGDSAEKSPSSLNWLLSVLQSDLGEIRDFGGTVRLFDDPNGLIIQLPNVAICKSHKMMHFGTTCPMC